ncbi:MAG: non-canonical purine NTP pyrophosphatase [Dehalococcoidia bacterium]
MPRPDPILLATSNPAKQAKLRWLLTGLGLKLLTPVDLGVAIDTPEEEADHRAVAEAKAMAWSRAGGIAALSSDGGLVIPALGHRWDALRTGRFAGGEADDRLRLDRLLELMARCHGDDRAASWVEAVAIADEGRVLASWQGESPRGRIAERYDPSRIIRGFWAFSVWQPPGTDKRYAELSPQEQEQADDHWSRLRAQVRAFFGAP